MLHSAARRRTPRRRPRPAEPPPAALRPADSIVVQRLAGNSGTAAQLVAFRTQSWLRPRSAYAAASATPAVFPEHRHPSHPERVSVPSNFEFFSRVGPLRHALSGGLAQVLFCWASPLSWFRDVRFSVPIQLAVEYCPSPSPDALAVPRAVFQTHSPRRWTVHAHPDLTCRT